MRNTSTTLPLKIFITTLSFMSLFTTACNQLGTERALTSEATEGADDIVSIVSDKLDVTINDATAAELSNFTFTCEQKICVEICHRPPGKPTKSKTLILPLQATLAHLKHGGPTHTEKDLLGPCVSDDSAPGEDTDDTTTDTDGSTDDETTTGTDDNHQEPEVPQWCTENIDIDSDCDGLIDTTGEPLY